MTRPLVHLILHTHWDREWYLPLGAFRARLVSALDGLLELLRRDGRVAGFLLDGQTVLLDDYLAVRPEQRDSVRSLAGQGRLQTGPWFVLADELIPAGESLVRNLLLGGSAARRLGGSVAVLYSPDAFGHPACLPELAQEFGLAGGVVWRGVGPQAMGGRDLAWWQAPSGRRLLLYHLPPSGYEIGSNLLVPKRDLAEAWRRVAGEVLHRAATRHVALFVGADHHAPDPDLGELAGSLQALVPECEFRYSRLDEFFAMAALEAGELAVLRGELRDSYGYTWTLQGVHATRAPLKRRHSALELLLTRIAEPLAAASGQGETTTAVLRQAWREVVQCQFHDAIAGCAADPVAQAVALRLTDAEAAGSEAARKALDAMAGHDPDAPPDRARSGSCLLVWNPAARARAGVVMGDLTFFRRDVLVGPPGGQVPRSGPGVGAFVLKDLSSPGLEPALQILRVERGLERVDAARHYPDLDEVDRVRVAVLLPQPVGALEARRFEPRPGASPAVEVFASAEGRLLGNGRVALAVESDGTAVLRVPGQGKPFSGLFGLRGERDLGDCYTFCPAPRDVVRRPARGGRPRVSAAGPLVAGLEWSVALRSGRDDRSRPGRVSARLLAEAVGDSPVLRCRITLDNQARDHRLRLCFPTGLRGVPILAGAQFGVAERPPAGNRAPPPAMETPVGTAPAHRFVAAARGDRGLALFAPGFFEYQWTPRGDLLFTLLRCVGELSRQDLPTRPGHAGWPTATPDAQCLGADVIEIGVAPVTGRDLEAPERLERLWEDTFVPLTAHWIRDFREAEGPAAPASGCALEGEGLVFSSLKPAEDGPGVILRCYNLRGAESTGRLTLARPVARATLTRADETAIGELPLALSGRVVSFTVPARGLATIRLE